MADAQILDAINGIKTSMAAMEQQLRAAPTKSDINALVTEIRGVKESVISNKDRIDTLYNLRKQDNECLVKRVEKMANEKTSGLAGQGSSCREENERNFLRSRRSIRLWPVQESGGLEKSIKRFLTFYLKMPIEVTDGLSF